MKLRKVAAALIAVVVLAGGCSREGETEFKPVENSLYITSEGVITSATIETYTEDYYDADEMKEETETVLGAFNQAAGGGTDPAPVTLTECSMEGGTARMQMEFRDPASYLKFMEEYPDEWSTVQLESIDIVPVPDGILKGYLVGADFKKANAEGKPVQADEVTKQNKMFVAAVTGTALIQTDGAIQDVSDQVEVIGKNQVRTPSEGVSFIVFK